MVSSAMSAIAVASRPALGGAEDVNDDDDRSSWDRFKDEMKDFWKKVVEVAPCVVPSLDLSTLQYFLLVIAAIVCCCFMCIAVGCLRHRDVGVVRCTTGKG